MIKVIHDNKLKLDDANKLNIKNLSELNNLKINSTLHEI